MQHPSNAALLPTCFWTPRQVASLWYPTSIIPSSLAYQGLAAQPAALHVVRQKARALIAPSPAGGRTSLQTSKQLQQSSLFQLDDGSTAMFCSQEDAFRFCPRLQLLLEESQKPPAHPRTLWRHMLRVDPTFRKRLFVVWPPLSQQLRLDRQLYAAEMLQQPQQYTHSMVFLDAKKLWVKKGSHMAWANAEAAAAGGMIICDTRAPYGSDDDICLHHYAAVSAATGAVSFVYVTGTTGLFNGYTVRFQDLPPYERVRQLMHRPFCRAFRAWHSIQPHAD